MQHIWECVGDQKGGADKRSIKYRPPAIQGGKDYIVKRLDQVDREMKRMFGEDRYLPWTSDRPGFYIKTYFSVL